MLCRRSFHNLLFKSDVVSPRIVTPMSYRTQNVEDMLLTYKMTFSENLNESLSCIDLVAVYLM